MVDYSDLIADTQQTSSWEGRLQKEASTEETTPNFRSDEVWKYFIQKVL